MVVLVLAGGLTWWLRGSPARSSLTDPGRPPTIDAELEGLLSRVAQAANVEDDVTLRDDLFAQTKEGRALLAALAYAPASPKWQRRARLGLHAMGPRMLGPVIRAFLKHDTPTARRFYVTATNIVPRPEVWLSGDDDPWARAWNAEERRGLRDVEAPLIARARQGGGHTRVQALSLLTLLPPESRTEASVPLLVDALMQDDAFLLQSATCALIVSAPLAQDAVPRLLRLLDGTHSDASEMAFSILRRIGKDDGVVAGAFLQRAEKEVDTQAWGTWISAVADMGLHARRMIPALRSVLESEASARHERAAEALARMGARADAETADLLLETPAVHGRPALLARLAKTRTWPGPATRAALRALDRAGNEAAKPALKGVPVREAPPRSRSER